MLTKNLFEVGQIRSFDPDKKSVVFISYRRTHCDMYMARECAKELEKIDKLFYWLDENDECMQHAQAQNDNVKTALCIEQGLDASSALLGIIGRCTFTSPWIPYEIGGARGRQRFLKQFARYSSGSEPKPHPLIAHLIHEIDIEEAPAFVALGTPLNSLEEVSKWAKSVAEILKQIQSGTTGETLLTESWNIQKQYGIQDIYDKNTQHLSS